MIIAALSSVNLKEITADSDSLYSVIVFRKVCDYCESLIKGCAGTAAG